MERKFCPYHENFPQETKLENLELCDNCQELLYQDELMKEEIEKEYIKECEILKQKNNNQKKNIEYFD